MTAAAPANYLPNGSVAGDNTAHLVRVDADRSKGWQLRLPKWHKHGPLTRLFPDHQFHGPVGSYAAAKAARDVYFENVPLTPMAYVSNSRSTSGISGVNLNFSKRLKGASAFSWVACWMENGKQQKLRFSIGGYDFETALDLAIAMRESKAGIEVSPEQRAQAMSMVRYVEAWEKHGTIPDFQRIDRVVPVKVKARLPQPSALGEALVPQAAVIM